MVICGVGLSQRARLFRQEMGMGSKTFWIPAGMALGLVAGANLAQADHVFQFTPLSVMAPDSRSFANSTVGSPGLLTAGSLATDPTGQLLYNFLDTWQFTLGSNADLIAFVGSINFTDGANDISFGIKNLQLSLSGPGGQVAGWQSAINFVGFQQLFSIVTQAPFAAGNYSLQVQGLLVGPQSSYAGTIQAVNPVPLPPSGAMFSAGLAVLGWHLRRRSRQ
jgi:hypothetical protein